MRFSNILIVALFFVASCKKDEVGPVTRNVKGVVQKGPFSIGSTISAFELSGSLDPSGKVFESQIADNRGSFSINNLNLASPYVALRADGFYFNEVTGQESNSQITLNCLLDITNKATVNINLLTHLEKPRIEYLVSQGIPFSIAKRQAEQEVLAVFSIAQPNIPESELLDLTQNGDDNAILLAISMILQGYRTEAELSHLLASISFDLSTDGILSNNKFGTELINHARLFNMGCIRNNIRSRWDALGITDSIPDFEKYINQFMSNTNYTITNLITYPESGIYGRNLLNMNDTLYSGDLSIAAFLPPGTSLRIEGPIGYAAGVGSGWDQLPNTNQGFTVLASNKNGYIINQAGIAGNGTIKFYENGSLTPTRIKNVYGQ
jgi:hypothetical protein